LLLRYSGWSLLVSQAGYSTTSSDNGAKVLLVLEALLAIGQAGAVVEGGVETTIPTTRLRRTIIKEGLAKAMGMERISRKDGDPVCGLAR
jgi:hypothetical protein